ncbi:SseB family protein [Blastococcus sp. TF02A-26]|uniref:SseB family protein n=1 Tax=Blastococcus sp. TF02A-26 TaxID=2250577 RepID=UPI000DE9F6DE|nr:SseB family protein [Blastococcus sp. TF02A-26]RBY86119.1 SseB family protein [Blastococcus sp. TF02A-26]
MDEHGGSGPDPDAFAPAWAAAARAGDDAARLALLRGADLLLPLPPGGAPAWVTLPVADRSWVPAWTSVEAMGAALAGTPAAEWTRTPRVAGFLDLAAGWPDPRFGLAVDLGTEHPLFLEPGALARLAVPDLADELAAAPGTVAVVQQLVPLGGIDPLLSGRHTRVSGYVQATVDVAHIGAPTVLLAALGRAAEERDLVTADGSVHLLRWPVLGPELYPVARGGLDEESRDAVAGWLVEEPPFGGLGLSPGGRVPVREYRVDGVALPHRTGLYELDVHGRETCRARYDAVRGLWQLVVPAGGAP